MKALTRVLRRLWADKCYILMGTEGVYVTMPGVLTRYRLRGFTSGANSDAKPAHGSSGLLAKPQLQQHASTHTKNHTAIIPAGSGTSIAVFTACQLASAYSDNVAI